MKGIFKQIGQKLGLWKPVPPAADVPAAGAPPAKKSDRAVNPNHAASPGRAGRPDAASKPSRHRGARRNRQGEAAAADTRGAVEKAVVPDPWTLADFDVPVVEGKTRFHDLNLPDPVMHAIADLKFSYCTPIQAEILPSTLAGKDATGRAQTGTGKTAAFLIAVITRMIGNPLPPKRPSGTPRVLIIAPTRELVLQIAAEARELSKYTRLNIVSVFGGMDYEKQRRQLNGRSVDIVVATPGRLLDFNRRHELHLGKVETLIIDEADRMLDMGFIPDVRQIVYKTPKKDRRQTLFFSATLTPDVTRLAEQWTRQPVVVEIEPEQVAVDTVRQLVYTVTANEKFALLYNIIVRQKLNRVIVFCNRRDETRRLGERFTRYKINCAIWSGEINQNKRIKTLEQFKAGKIRILVATDVAGRGIHIEGMDYVINYTLPRDPEDYVHRIGRTGRAGEAGTSISFACEEDSFYIPPIEEFIGNELHCTQPDEDWLVLPPPPPLRKRPSRKKTNPGGHSRKPAAGAGAADKKRPGSGRRRPRPRKQGSGSRSGPQRKGPSA